MKTRMAIAALAFTFSFQGIALADDSLGSITLSVALNGAQTTLAWTPAGGATKYTLFFAPYPDISYVGNVELGGLTQISADLWDGAAFYALVGAYDATGLIAVSNIVKFHISLQRNYVIAWKRADFVAENDTYWTRGWILQAVNSFVFNGEVLFNAVWQSDSTENNYVIGWKRDDFVKENEGYWKKGWIIQTLDSYQYNGEVLFNASWQPTKAAHNYVIGWNWDDFIKENEKYWNQGWRLHAIDSYVINGAVYFNAVWREGNSNSNYVLGWSWDDFIKENEKYWNQGWHLDAIDSYVINGAVYFNAVWQKDNREMNYVLGWKRTDFDKENEKYWNQGWELSLIDTYVINGEVFFNGVWQKDLSPPPGGVCGYADLLPETVQAPYGAVGFISNGCTGTLIDPQHVLTAAHCLLNEGAASGYFTDLWFYPNYTGNRFGPPRMKIDRAVVGSHGQTCCEYATSDWSIAHLETPAYGFPALAPWARTGDETNAVVAHYTRDKGFFGAGCVTPVGGCDCGIPPINNDEYDCVCAYPPFAGEYGCYAGWAKWNGNVWWQDGLVSYGKVSHDPNSDYSQVSGASGGGGASGSPHLVRDEAGSWRVVGVTHGADCNGVSGPWAGRFLWSPRFAASAAVASSPTSSGRSGVFVLDTDENRLVYRDRDGTGPSPDSSLAQFSYYRFLKAAPAGSTRIAAFKQKGSGLPAVMTLDSGGSFNESIYDGSGWTEWEPVSGLPLFTATDMDVTSDKNDTPSLYAVHSVSGGRLYRKLRNGASVTSPWQTSWQAIVSNDTAYAYWRVTALRHHSDKVTQVWALSTSGVIRTVKETGTGLWTAVTSHPLPPLNVGEQIVDIDAAWNPLQRGMLVALSSRGRVWFSEASNASSTAGWSAWTLLPGNADPGVSINRNGVLLVSVTASRWQEVPGTDGGADIVPVVFATDSWGNVFQSTYRKAGGGMMAWSDWMPFYGKRVDSEQAFQD